MEKKPGTVGKALSVEALKITLENMPGLLNTISGTRKEYWLARLGQ